MKIAKKILFVLFALFMLNSGLNKFFNYMPMPELKPDQLKVFEALGVLKWIIPLAGIVEVIAAILILVPRYRALGALMIFPIVVGIVLHHLVLDPSGLILVLIMLTINVLMFVDNKRKLVPLISE